MEKAGIESGLIANCVGLVVEAEERDNREDDCAEEDLGDVVVEDLLVGVRSIGIVFGFGLASGAEGFCCGRHILGYGHGRITPLVRGTEVFLCVAAVRYVGSSPAVQGARVFITKVPPRHKGFLQEKRIFSRNGNGRIMA
jgi:hypothetical protein